MGKPKICSSTKALFGSKSCFLTFSFSACFPLSPTDVRAAQNQVFHTSLFSPFTKITQENNPNPFCI